MPSTKLKKVVTGVALTLAAPVVLPIAKNVLQPLLVLGRKGASELANRTRYAMEYTREEIEDFIAEAQFERMKRKFDRELGLTPEENK
ncbi:DUF5132 domain-containing protein [Effusibacillus dendaii]|uniref:DUF5132 domain-containing protein n=1 Tax=Effusibacillus dendaii TaxID=2743772 RepID=A0A7I8DGB4_9BACL|nr:DUF5132 domain-containing protein [Effusibacillus dendaii]BCJ88382.1 hypothetical protein skT53_33670 [Effusibacillus dendaii]